MDETTEAILLIKAVIQHLHGADGCPTCVYKHTDRAGFGHENNCAWEQLENVCDELVAKTR